MSGPYRAPTAWTVCLQCGAVVADRDQHEQWHVDLDGQLAALQPQPVEEAPPTDDSSGEV